MYRQKNDAELRELAKNILLKVFTYSSTSTVNLKTLVARFTDIVSGATIKIVADNELKKDLAYADCDKKDIYIRKSVYDRALKGVPRDRWTLVHELSHLILRHTGIRSRASEIDLRAKNLPLVKAQESEANRLTAEILAPYELCKNIATPEEIETLTKLSKHAAKIRFADIASAKRIAKKQKRALPIEVIDLLKGYESKGQRLRHINTSEAEKRRTQFDLEKSTKQGFETTPCPACQNRTLINRAGGRYCETCGWPPNSDYS